MTKSSEEQRTPISYCFNLVNKEVNEQVWPRLKGYKGDGWQTKPIRRSSLQKILITNGYAVNGCELGPMVWDGTPDFQGKPTSDSGFQRVVRENVIQVHLVGLDFDNFEDRPTEGTTIEDALHDPILSTAAFGYTSSSHPKSPQDKYRLLWWLPHPLSVAEAEALLRKMIRLWPGVDPQCTNPNRTWYGHKDGDVILRDDTSVLPIEEINDRYEIEIDDLVDPVSFTGAGAAAPLGTDDVYIQGFHDAFADEVGLAIKALSYIPRRGRPGASNTYASSIATLMGLVQHFGPHLAMEIVDAADWEGPHWDIRQKHLGSVIAAVHRNRQNKSTQGIATLGSVLKRAKAFGMSSKEIASFRRNFSPPTTTSSFMTPSTPNGCQHLHMD